MEKRIITQINIPEPWYEELKQKAKDEKLDFDALLIRLLAYSLSLKHPKLDGEAQKSSNSSSDPH